MNEDWEERTAAAWATFDDYDEATRRLPGGDRRAGRRAARRSPLGPFEQACAWDSTGHSDKAVPLYREALARGSAATEAPRQDPARQFAAEPREAGGGRRAADPELDAPSDELDDAVRACLALCLADLGREREGLALVIGASPPICRAISGRWRTTRGSWSSPSSARRVTIHRLARFAMCAVTGCSPAPRTRLRPGRRRRAGRGRARRALSAAGPARLSGAAAEPRPQPPGADRARPHPARAAPGPDVR